MRRHALIPVALALACVAALAAVPVPVRAHVNDVRAGPQVSADGTVLVETAYVADDAWLAVYRDDDGSRGELLATRQLSGAGFRTDFAATIDEDAWSDWSEGEARRLHVALHKDEGSSGFDREEDPVLTFFGREATDQFVLERGPGAYVGARAFSPQETDDPTVRVRTVRLPDEGHLVARNVTDPGDETEAAAEPVGATALDAGTHANVTVTLDESYYETLGARPRIAFTVYPDDGDGTFDGDEEPIRAGEHAVTTFIYLNRTDAPGGGDGSGTPTDGGGAVTTATATGDDDSDGDDGGLVTTATPSAAEGTATDEASADGGGGASDGGVGDEDGDDPTSTDGQPGFGPLAVVLAVVTTLTAGAARRRT